MTNTTLSLKGRTVGAKPEGHAKGQGQAKAFGSNKAQGQGSAQIQAPKEYKSNAQPFSFKPRSASGRSNGGIHGSQGSHGNFERGSRNAAKPRNYQSFGSDSGSRPRSASESASGRVFNKTLAGTQPVPGLTATPERPNPHHRSERRDSEHRGSERRDFNNGGKKDLRVAIGSQSRAAAAKVLEAVAQGKSLAEAFPQFCVGLDERDTAFVKEIVFGTLRQRRLLMNTMLPMVEHQLNEKHRIVHWLIISAMYQLVFLQSPPHAVVSATVSACGECGQKAFASMVNAVLRRFLRENMQLKHSDDPAVEYSFPDWLSKSLIEAYGDKAPEVMQNSNIKPPLILRVENSKLSTADFMQQLAAKEIGAYLVDPVLAPAAVVLDVATNVSDIPGFDKGQCSVQDLSAQLAAPLLELQGDAALAAQAHDAQSSAQDNKTQTQALANLPRLRVLDCCCAPGGKTAHILDLNPNCEVMALDVDEARLQQTKSTLKRLGRKVELQVMDAQDLSSLPGVFDRILVDAPCSGTGVIRRHPDIKWLRRNKDIENLTAIQAKILDEAYAKLAAGGILLYTTCSILPAENDEQIKAFLTRHPDARLKPFKVEGETYQTWQRLPGEQNGDGFFYARIVKA